MDHVLSGAVVVLVQAGMADKVTCLDRPPVLKDDDFSVFRWLAQRFEQTGEYITGQLPLIVCCQGGVCRPADDVEQLAKFTFCRADGDLGALG